VRSLAQGISGFVRIARYRIDWKLERGDERERYWRTGTDVRHDDIKGPSTSTRSGFQGAIENLPLVDLLQVWSMNGFSGLVTISSQGNSGHLYFVEGGIVHAEADGLAGERAVRRILAWPEGSFDLHPNTTTLHRTIEKSMAHLLLEAHRHLDEERRDTPAPSAPTPGTAAARPPPPLPASAPPAPARAPLFDQIRAIRGVTQVVRFGKDGRPMGESGAALETLAANGLYLAMTHAAAVAEAFGLHDLGVAAMGGREPFVLLHSQAQYLCVALAPDVAIDPVIAQLRALLSRPAPRKP